MLELDGETAPIDAKARRNTSAPFSASGTGATFVSAAETGPPAARTGASSRASRRCASQPQATRTTASDSSSSSDASARRFSHQYRGGSGQVGSTAAEEEATEDGVKAGAGRAWAAVSEMAGDALAMRSPDPSFALQRLQHWFGHL